MKIYLLFNNSWWRHTYEHVPAIHISFTIILRQVGYKWYYTEWCSSLFSCNQPTVIYC